ncbi:DUF6020 family protein [Lachnospiraceae bacterium JLR.KK008]
MKTKDMIRVNSHLICAVCAFLATWATVRACGISTFHLFGGLLFVIYLLLVRQFRQWSKTAAASALHKIVSAALAALFVFFYLCADYEALLGGLSSSLFRLGHLIIIGAGLFCIFYVMLFCFFQWLNDCSPFADATQKSDRFYNRLPLFAFFFCLLCWLPYLATNYPGVMTVDSLNQYGQIIGALPMSNHHPWVHTQLIRLFYEIGIVLTKNPLTGLGLYTLFQMAVMAGIFAYLIDLFVRLCIKKRLCLIVIAFYALLPYNAIYMITMWKDILFSGMTLLFSVVLLRFLIHSRQEAFPLTRRTYLLYLLSGLGLCLLRSNGFCAFLLTVPFLLLCFRRQWKRHLLLNLLILLPVLLIKGPLMNACHVASPDFVESLSIPIQLAARVYVDQEETDPADDEMWNRIVDTSRIPETYESFCSDHMKNLIRQGDQAYLEAHKADYLKLWVSFGRKHPGAYVRGYIDATKGYWYPDVPNVIGSDERIADNPYGLSAKPLLHNPVTIKIKEIVFKLPDMIPVYGLLFSLGAMFWLSLALAGKTVLSGRRNCLIVFLPNGAIFATLFLATPVYNEFRYGYPMLLTIPLFALCALYSGKGTEAGR